VAAAGWYRNTDLAEAEKEPVNPLQFWSSLQMAFLFQVVLYAVHWLKRAFGDQGLLVTGALLGMTDVDALTISMARGVENGSWSVVARALTLGILSNTVLKAVAAGVLGQGGFRWFAVAGLAAIAGSLVVSLVVLN
jgi:uncharacterized membrane protein (DUF4010 family)